ncbi:unnamed protein product [Rodentolepis nana]|uniref:Lipoprotein n=1 Tax=Rodentolepis nana TaxID=102285 RepID=A0A0R3TA88_RODNA|nr:unnamed protein product [Rodentolepis nana]
MACVFSLGFSYLVSKIKIQKHPIIIKCLFIHTIIIYIVLSGCYSYKLDPVSSFNNTVNSTFSQSSNAREWRFNSVQSFAQSISSNSIVFFNNEKQINRLKRLNKPIIRRFEQATRVIYRNITIPNKVSFIISFIMMIWHLTKLRILC